MELKMSKKVKVVSKKKPMNSKNEIGYGSKVSALRDMGISNTDFDLMNDMYGDIENVDPNDIDLNDLGGDIENDLF
tara:strand:- start:444 stop:671 length:228 start_codon:yes stop_codon:yes gene_type:complete